MFVINRHLVIKEGPMHQSFDPIILQKVKEYLGRIDIDWTDHKLVKRDTRRMTRTYYVKAAYNFRDK